MLKFLIVATSLILLTEATLVSVPLRKVREQKSKANELVKLKAKYNILDTRSVHVDTLFNYEDYSYCGVITIGAPGQEFLILLDTGSSDLWVPVKPCASANTVCQNYDHYDPDASSTYKYNGESFAIQYGSGYLTGYLVEDSVTIEGMEIKNQVFAAVTNEPGDTFVNSLFDGVMGMAFKAYAIDGATPPFYNLVLQNLLDSEVFSFYLARNGTSSDGGVMVLGGNDANHYSGDFHYVPVSSEGYWQFEMNSAEVNGVQVCDSCQAIADTGTILIAVPSDSYKIVQQAIGAIYSDCTYAYMLNCSMVDSLPVLTFHIGTGTFTLEGKDYIIQSDYQCTSAFEDAGTDFWALGDVFMEKYYTTFDFKNKRVGFAIAK